MTTLSMTIILASGLLPSPSPEANAQLACSVAIPGFHWCDESVEFSFEGPAWNGFVNGGQLMKNAVNTMVVEITQLDLQGIPIHLTQVSPGSGKIKLYFEAIPEDPSKAGIWLPTSMVGPEYISGKIRFNSNILTLGTAYSRETVALHEFLHALGLGAAINACPNTTVMIESIHPGDVRTTIDVFAANALECIYGNDILNQCGLFNRLFARWLALPGGGTRITKGTCNGCGPSCSLSMEGDTVTTGINYEIAISDGGGPFVVVATLSESDWVNNEYDYVPAVGFESAILRVQVFDNGVLFDETQTWDPIRIEGVPGTGEATLLMLSRPAGFGDPPSLMFRWGPSCTGTVADYAIYEGMLGNWYSHTLLDCSDEGADLQETITVSPGNRYYLIVPLASTREGSYGADSHGVERAPGIVRCLPLQALVSCP